MKLEWREIAARAAAFSERHRDARYEKGETQTFYNEFFACFGVDRKTVATYEQRVRNLPGDRQGFIDLFMPGVLIVEQKSAGLDLRRASDQALDYHDGLPEAQRPRYILTCDFQRWDLLDLETRQRWNFALPELKKHVTAFAFIVGTPRREFRNQKPANPKASELLAKLHRNLEERGYEGHKLQLLLVRLLFILFADDTGIWEKDKFLVFLEQRTSPDGRDLGRWIAELFQTLDTPEGRRPAGWDADLNGFPHINGKLFEERIDNAVFDNATRDILLDASLFNWGEVSPAIFGALFEGVIDKVTRRKRGAHYTPEEAIQKLIDPLFLDDLYAEFERIKARRSGRAAALEAFHDKLARLTFLDPACGAGNFLVVAYRELRELERLVIGELRPDRQLTFDVALLSKCDVGQFHGIEIDEFPSQIAQVALWMTDHIANTALGNDFGRAFARIPLVTAPGIRHGDALELDWNAVLPTERCCYVLGNPPFAGSKVQSDAQRAQVRRIARLGGSGGTLDYVAAWFIKAADYAAQVPPRAPLGEGDHAKHGGGAGPAATGDPAAEGAALASCAARPSGGPSTAFGGRAPRSEEDFGSHRIAFVATNSVTQGEQVAQLWPQLFGKGWEIGFAHRTFVWPGRAAVHCVIVGLDRRGTEPTEKRLFSYPEPKGAPVETEAAALTAYLFDAKSADRHLVVESARAPINGAPPLVIGSKPIDGGHYIFGATARAKLLVDDPAAVDFLRPYVGSEEFINGGQRWIMALHDAAPATMRSIATLRERVAKVRAFRLASRSGPTQVIANTPTRYHVNVLPDRPFLVIPEVSSERRDYVPIGWLEPPTIPSNLVRVLLDASTWHFGLLTSAMHMSWLRQIGGRLKSDYRYSIGLVYNTFPWPEEPSPAQVAKIETLAQAVLDARALPKNATSTLADLYDPDTMPAELRRAHRDLDAAVDRLYAPRGFADDRARVEHLFARYQRLIEPTRAAPAANRRTARRTRAAQARAD